MCNYSNSCGCSSHDGRKQGWSISKKIGVALLGAVAGAVACKMVEKRYGTRRSESAHGFRRLPQQAAVASLPEPKAKADFHEVGQSIGWYEMRTVFPERMASSLEEAGYVIFEGTKQTLADLDPPKPERAELFWVRPEEMGITESAATSTVQIVLALHGFLPCKPTDSLFLAEQTGPDWWRDSDLFAFMLTDGERPVFHSIMKSPCGIVFHSDFMAMAAEDEESEIAPHVPVVCRRA
jgi:hypothetical protein